jgi:hypothetical protein
MLRACVRKIWASRSQSVVRSSMRRVLPNGSSRFMQVPWSSPELEPMPGLRKG